MAYHVESFLVCDCCHGTRVVLQGCNGRDVLEREAERRGWDVVPLESVRLDVHHGKGNRCRGCRERAVRT